MVLETKNVLYFCRKYQVSVKEIGIPEMHAFENEHNAALGGGSTFLMGQLWSHRHILSSASTFAEHM